MTECAVILAGGQASRMGGGDKGLLMLGDQSLIQRVIDRITPQVDAVDLAQRLAGYDTPVVLAATPDPERGRVPQPTFGRWQVALRHDLRAALNDGVRKIRQWTQAQGETLVVFEEDDFFNINTPEDLAWAEQHLK